MNYSCTVSSDLDFCATEIRQDFIKAGWGEKAETERLVRAKYEGRMSPEECIQWGQDCRSLARADALREVAQRMQDRIDRAKPGYRLAWVDSWIATMAKGIMPGESGQMPEVKL